MQRGAVVGVAEGSANGRSKILGAQESLLRIYVAPDTGILLGASMLLAQGEHLAHLIAWAIQAKQTVTRSEEHTSELQSLMRISYAVFCLKKKKKNKSNQTNIIKLKKKMRKIVMYIPTDNRREITHEHS